MDVVWQSTQVYCAGLDTLQRQIAEESTRPIPTTPGLTASGSSSSSSFGSQSSQSSQQSQRRPRGRPPRKGAIVPTEAQIIMKERMESMVAATVSGYIKSRAMKAQKRPKTEPHSISTPASTDAMDVDVGPVPSAVPPQKRTNAERVAPGSNEPGGLLGIHPRRGAMHASASTPALSNFTNASSASTSTAATSLSRAATAAPLAPTRPPPPKFVASSSQSQPRSGTRALGMRRPPTFVAKSRSAPSSGPKPFKPPLASAVAPAPAPGPAQASTRAPAAAAPAHTVTPEAEDEADTSDTSFGSVSFDIDSETIEAICSQYDRPV
ncbi:hypothetical protein AURDEDRAFT_144910 [Auricularia subglabra TFB-10046 SS5]|nr:hypothetical protein AURDEDRAFT_144910 [Auricularia subglabra TFB-10046 SS5]